MGVVVEQVGGGKLLVVFGVRFHSCAVGVLCKTNGICDVHAEHVGERPDVAKCDQRAAVLDVTAQPPVHATPWRNDNRAAGRQWSIGSDPLAEEASAGQHIADCVRGRTVNDADVGRRLGAFQPGPDSAEPRPDGFRALQILAEFPIVAGRQREVHARALANRNGCSRYGLLDTEARGRRRVFQRREP